MLRRLLRRECLLPAPRQHGPAVRVGQMPLQRGGVLTVHARRGKGLRLQDKKRGLVQRRQIGRDILEQKAVTRRVIYIRRAHVQGGARIPRAQQRAHLRK